MCFPEYSIGFDLNWPLFHLKFVESLQQKNIFDTHLADVECCHGKNAQQQIDGIPNAHVDFGGFFIFLFLLSTIVSIFIGT